MEALSYCSWFDQIPFADTTGDIGVEIFHKMLPLGSHSRHNLAAEEKKMFRTQAAKGAKSEEAVYHRSW